MTASKPQILIIEDDATVLKPLETKFEADGLSVVTAADGLAGLKTALEQEPELILLDIIMPRMDGLTMLQKLRASGAYGKSVPVVVLTNLSDAESVEEAAANGVYDFLVKANWQLKDLVDLVKTKLNK